MLTGNRISKIYMDELLKAEEDWYHEAVKDATTRHTVVLKQMNNLSLFKQAMREWRELVYSWGFHPQFDGKHINYPYPYENLTVVDETRAILFIYGFSDVSAAFQFLEYMHQEIPDLYWRVKGFVFGMEITSYWRGLEVKMQLGKETFCTGKRVWKEVIEYDKNCGQKEEG